MSSRTPLPPITISSGHRVIGLVNNKLVNQNLSWESTNVLNLGLELGFLNSRLTAEMDLSTVLQKASSRARNYPPGCGASTP